MDDLGQIWEYFAKNECHGYSPVYERICSSLASDHELLNLVREAPPAAHQPNVLLAAVRYLLLGGLEHRLGDIYSGEDTTDPWPAFRDLVLSNADDVLAVMSERRTQTNEVGRVATLMPALEVVRRRYGAPLALIDVGASAGLNLMLDKYCIAYPDRLVGPAEEEALVTCAVLGRTPPLPSTPIPISSRVGLDRNPVDVGDEASCRWLESCVWPDHPDRALRLRRAIAIAAQDPPDVRTGDAVDDVAALVAEAPDDAVVCAITTWALAYLSPLQRADFVAALSGSSRPIAWVAAEAPGVVPGLEPGPPPKHPGISASALSLTNIEAGKTSTELLAWVHPHGAWIDWRQ